MKKALLLLIFIPVIMQGQKKDSAIGKVDTISKWVIGDSGITATNLGGTIFGTITLGGTGSVMSQNYDRNKNRVIETLLNLPIFPPDWRFEDLANHYTANWKNQVSRISIIHTDSDTILGESPGLYTSKTVVMYEPPWVYVIYINPVKFNQIDNESRVVEHELYHAAFEGADLMPGWMMWLMLNTADINKENGGDHIERAARASVARRDIIDYYKIPLNSMLTLEQIELYIENNKELDAGMKLLISTTKPKNMVHLLNFENGWEISPF